MKIKSLTIYANRKEQTSSVESAIIHYLGEQEKYYVDFADGGFVTAVLPNKDWTLKINKRK